MWIQWKTAAVFLVLTGPVPGQLLLSYEANVFPEDDGWDGRRIDPLSTRSVEDGIFSIQAPAGADRSDYERNLLLTSDEIFYEWSARTTGDGGESYVGLTLSGSTVYSGISVGLWGDNAHISLDPDIGTPGQAYVNVPLEAGQFHTFRVESEGALYTVYIDGIAYASEELESSDGSNVRVRLAFIHSFTSIPTESEWDYVRIGEIPEPGTGGLVLLALSVLTWRRC